MPFGARLTRMAVFLAVATVMGMFANWPLAAQALPGSAIIPPERITAWQPGVNVGVPGGIPANRTHLIDVTKAPYNADKTGATDAQPAIASAIAAAGTNDVVYLPAGTYRINTAIVTGLKNNFTIRGDGPDKTVIMTYHTDSQYHPHPGAIDIGVYVDYPWDKPTLNVTGSPARGASVLTVGDTSALSSYPNGGVGQVCCISLKNDEGLPVLATAHYEYLRRQMTRIIAKTSTTLTISPPLLFDLPLALAPRVGVASRQTEFVGVEDLKIDATNSTCSSAMIYMKQCYGCWVKNVHIRQVLNRQMWLDSCFACEIRGNYTAWRRGDRNQPDGPAFLMAMSSGCLVEDNIFAHQFPLMEIDSGSSGNVFGYNYCYDSTAGSLIGCAINTNHGAHNSLNLYEGNVASKFQSDGYWGSASHETAFRNWFHGTEDTATQFGICIYLNRFTRNYSIVGNVLGRKGYTYLYDNANTGFGYNQRFIYVFGMPNIGNGGFNGKMVQPSRGIYWADWRRLRTSALGSGPGAGGFQELDLDVKATTLLRGNYNYRDKGVPASESLHGVKLPASLYLAAKPAWFGKLAWPAFGPDTAMHEKNKIPAQVRFEQMPQ